MIEYQSWTGKDVVSWLKGFSDCDLEECIPMFESNEIKGIDLPLLTNDVLRDDLNIKAHGRIKIRRAVRSLTGTHSGAFTFHRVAKLVHFNGKIIPFPSQGMTNVKVTC